MPESLDGNQNTLIIEDPIEAGGYTHLENALLFTPHLSPAAKITYMALRHYAWQTGRCWPGQERLAADLHVDRSSVKRYLHELASKGFIVVRRRGLTLTNLYRLPPLRGVLAALDEPPDGSNLSHQDGAPLHHQDGPSMSHEYYSVKYDTENTPPVASPPSSPQGAAHRRDDDADVPTGTDVLDSRVLRAMTVLGEPPEDAWWWAALQAEHFPGLSLDIMAQQCLDYHRRAHGAEPRTYGWKTAMWDWLVREQNPPAGRAVRGAKLRTPPMPSSDPAPGSPEEAERARFQRRLAKLNGHTP